MDNSLRGAISQLRHQGIDSLMIFGYDFDNGRVPEAVYYLIWIKKGEEFVQTFEGGITYSPTSPRSVTADSLFILHSRITQQKLPPLEHCLQFHDMGYSIEVFVSGKRAIYNVRNCQRRQVGIPELLPGEVEASVKDPRILLVDMFERIIK